MADKPTFSYERLRGTEDSFMRQYSAYQQYHNPWVIKNMLPTKFNLYCQPAFTDDFHLVGTIEPHEEIKYSPNAFKDGDELFTVYMAPNGKPVPFMGTHVIRANFKDIKLGAVTYSHGEDSIQYNAVNPRSEILGLWIHNKMNIPIDIFYKNNLVAQLYADDGMTYFGGSASSVWFSNGRQGLRYGDELYFRYSVPGSDKKLFSVELDDNFLQNINVGVVDAGMYGPDPDTYAYSIDKPTWTGITYYKPIGNYNTRSTNPLAPF